MVSEGHCSSCSLFRDQWDWMWKMSVRATHEAMQYLRNRSEWHGGWKQCVLGDSESMSEGKDVKIIKLFLCTSETVIESDLFLIKQDFLSCSLKDVQQYCIELYAQVPARKKSCPCLPFELKSITKISIWFILIMLDLDVLIHQPFRSYLYLLTTVRE